MLENALKILNKIEDAGFKAYIVGGFVRDHLLGIESNDIDICTSAQPKDVRQIFKNACLPNEDYGSVTVIVKNIRYEITTFRKEYSYIGNRKPDHFEFIDDLYEDLKRRDFLINTLCIDSHGNILDILNGRVDLKNKIINTVGNSYDRFNEDAFRILRAIRFATTLNFKLSDEIKEAINKTKYLLKNISYERKREELDRIFTSPNVQYGVSLLIKSNLDSILEINNLRNISNFDDLMGVWAQLGVAHIYNFSKNERQLIKQIQEVLRIGIIDNSILYKYGLYVTSVVAGIKGLDKKKITENYNKLPIKSRSEILIDGNDIMDILHIEPGELLKTIISDIESRILDGTLINDKDCLSKYIYAKYYKK